jgi:hypothetical protein
MIGCGDCHRIDVITRQKIAKVAVDATVLIAARLIDRLLRGFARSAIDVAYCQGAAQGIAHKRLN